MRRLLPAALCAALACNPTTTRPPFPPLPEAAAVRLDLPVALATRSVAEQLRADSIPVLVVDTLDGWLDSGWFDATTGAAVSDPPPGPDAARVRAWLDPWRPHEASARIEGVWRPIADPSLPARELEAPLPPGHPVAIRLRRAVDSLRARHGHVEQPDG